MNQCIFGGAVAIGQRLRTITTSTELAMADNTALSYEKVTLSVFGTVATDLNYLDVIRVILRSEQ